jgi:hypothetical protein
VAPLIFGVQRFSASSGLAANQSELQIGVAGGMGWASGSFGAFGGGGGGGGGGGSRRRLSIWLARRLVQEELISESDDGSQRLWLRQAGRRYLQQPWPIVNHIM